VEEGEVVVGLTVAAGGDPSLGFHPRVRAFHGEALAGLGVGSAQPTSPSSPHLAGGRAGGEQLACAARPGDAGLDLALAQRPLERGRGITAVGPHLLRADAAAQERVQEREQVPALVLVACGEAYLERCAAGVYGQVVAAPGPAQERARDLLAPFFASTSEASTITRDQSSLSPSASSTCRTAIAAGSSPRADHSSSRRRQVSPLGSPSSR
jgi:hypothetical protein